MSAGETSNVLAVGSKGRLQLGLNLPTWENRHGQVADWAQIQELAKLAEHAGIDTLWVPDHIAIGPHVVCTSYRNPALLAKMATTLDEVSSGRLLLGLGSGLPELDASWGIFGYPTDHPVSRFEEAVEIIARLLREGYLDFQGRYYQVRDCELRPRGRRRNGPPIWIAAKGPRMLRLVARWADAFNYQAPGATPSEVAEVFTHLDDVCRELGRDPATLVRTAYTLITFAQPDSEMTGPRAQAVRGSPEEIAAHLHAFHAVGVQHLTCWIDAGDDPELRTFFPLLTARGLEQFVPVIEALRKLENT
jgi:alkanesulfonate monooxygenase SsuD/methylene tetrahydromethanopterin reductase-like flavin-dependent oxidoreductase (luciferase family)